MLPFSFRANSGETVEIWIRSNDRQTPGTVLIGGAGADARLEVLPSDDFLKTSFFVPQNGTVTVTPVRDTVVSLAYAFRPENVLLDGIRPLFRSEAIAPIRGPGFHLAPAFGWMNDPNGMIAIGNEIHVFYQNYPHSYRWNTMHWGHAVSHDGGATFKHLPIFLNPRTELLQSNAESGGAFSGSAILADDGGMRVFYTDRQDSREPEWEWQMTAISKDRVTVGPSSPVIDHKPALTGLIKDFRDPYVFKGPDNRWKLLLAGGDADGSVIYLYETENASAATGWAFVDILFRSSGHGVGVAECPCFLRLTEDLWCLIFCLMASTDPETGRRNISHAVIGHFDGKAFTALQTQEVDFGTDAYAFQATTAPEGLVGLGWAANWYDRDLNTDFPTAMTLMRRFEWRGDHLATPPADSLKALRKRLIVGEVTGQPVSLPDGCAEIEFTLSSPNAPFRLELAHPSTDLAVVSDGEWLEIEHHIAGQQAGPRYKTRAPQLSTMRVFIDRGVLEVYGNDGQFTGTKRIADFAPVTGVKLTGAGVASLTIWEL